MAATSTDPRRLNQALLTYIISKIKDLIPDSTTIRTGNYTFVSTDKVGTGTTLSTANFNTIDGVTPQVNDNVIDASGTVCIITAITNNTATVSKLLNLAAIYAPINNPTFTGTVTAPTTVVGTKLSIPGATAIEVKEST